MKLASKISILLGAVFLAGCGQVYNPYLMLPKEPLRTGEFQVVVGAGGIPSISEGSTGMPLGQMGLFRYGVSDNLTLQGEEWSDHVPSVTSNGVAVAAIYLLPKRDSAWRFAIIPRAAVMNDGNDIKGWGASATLAAWAPSFLNLHPYFGMGILGGTGRVDYQVAQTSGPSTTASRYDLGLGVSLNAGVEYEVFDHLTLNAELASAAMLIRSAPSSYYHNAFWVGGIGGGYRF